MTKTNLTGVDLPRDFHVAAYDEVNRRVAEMIPNKPDLLWEHFATAWNAVGYRLAAAGRADNRFVEAHRRADRVREELSLFTFLSTACSAVECAAYAIHAVGAVLAPSVFPMTNDGERRAIGLSSTAGRLEQQYPLDPLAAQMRQVASEPEWLQLVDWRDVEIHRGTPARSINVSAGGPPPPPDVWRVAIHRGADVPLGPGITHKKRRWLVRTINELVAEFDRFLTRRGAA